MYTPGGLLCVHVLLFLRLIIPPNSLSFINRRNQNYHDIVKGMNALKTRRLNQFHLTNQFHHLFFFGDLNYRVDLGATEIVEFAKRQDHVAIYNEDQLRKEKERKKVFVGFGELGNAEYFF